MQKEQNLVQISKFFEIPTILRCFTRLVKRIVEVNARPLRNILGQKNQLFTKVKNTNFLSSSNIFFKQVMKMIFFIFSEHRKVIILQFENHFLVKHF